jgi:hypothetical protein
MADSATRGRWRAMILRFFAVPRLEAIIEQSHQVAILLEQVVVSLERAVDKADRRASDRPETKGSPDEQRR